MTRRIPTRIVLSLLLASSTFALLPGGADAQTQPNYCHQTQPYQGCYVCYYDSFSYRCTWIPAYCDEYPDDPECDPGSQCTTADCYCQYYPNEDGCVCDETGCHYETCADVDEPACHPCQGDCGGGCELDDFKILPGALPVDVGGMMIGFEGLDGFVPEDKSLCIPTGTTISEEILGVLP